MKIIVHFIHRVTSLLLLVLLSPIVKCLPQFTNRKVEDDQWRREYRELTTEIIFSLQQYSLGNNILTADIDIHDYLGHLDGEKIHQKLIPIVVFGKKKKLIHSTVLPNSDNGTSVPSSLRFSSSNFVHINVQQNIPTSKRRWKWNRATQFDPHWKKLYSLTMGETSTFTKLPDRSRLYDYFLNFQQSLSTTMTTHPHKSKTEDNLEFYHHHHHRRNIRSFVEGGPKSQTNGIPENIIWIQMQVINNHNYYPVETLKHKMSVGAQSEKCIRDHSSSSSLLLEGGLGVYAQDKKIEMTLMNSGSNFSSKNVPDDVEFFEEFNSQWNDEDKKLKNLQDNQLDCYSSNSSNEKIIASENIIDSQEFQNEVKFFLSCDESCIIEGSNFDETSQNLVDSPQQDVESFCHETQPGLSGTVFMNGVKKNSKFTACILHSIVFKMKTKFQVVLSPPAFDLQNGGLTDIGLEESVEIFKRNVDSKLLENYGKGTLYNSLVFIAKKPFNTFDNTLSFSWAGWLAIVLACGAAAINFTKILTMTGSDQLSWYDFVIQQILELMHDDRTSRKKFLSHGSSENGENNQTHDDAVLEERGKASKALLHGTIRVVSFVLLAIYEGKLYNTITFPKNRFVSTFNELLTNDKYALKISREATNVDFLMATKNHSLLNRFSESFNIEDCINWVEHSVSHGCVAYDFEFRNLPKAHKVRVLNDVNIFAKSKTSILNFSFQNYKPYAALHPAAQISRWILEAGIFQFWMVAENFFTENLIPSRVTKRKFFSIKDYIGLFVIYVTLLVLAVMIFTSEIIVNWFKKKFEHRSLVDFIIIFWENVKKIAKTLWQICVQIKNFFMTRQKCCIKIRRIANNIV